MQRRRRPRQPGDIEEFTVARRERKAATGLYSEMSAACSSFAEPVPRHGAAAPNDLLERISPARSLFKASCSSEARPSSESGPKKSVFESDFRVAHTILSLRRLRLVAGLITDWLGRLIIPQGLDAQDRIFGKKGFPFPHLAMTPPPTLG